MKLVKLVVLKSSGSAPAAPTPLPPPPLLLPAPPAPPAPGPGGLSSSASKSGWSMSRPSPRPSQRMERYRGLFTSRHSLAGKLLGLMGVDSSASSIARPGPGPRPAEPGSPTVLDPPGLRCALPPPASARLPRPEPLAHESPHALRCGQWGLEFPPRGGRGGASPPSPSAGRTPGRGAGRPLGSPSRAFLKRPLSVGSPEGSTPGNCGS